MTQQPNTAKSIDPNKLNPDYKGMTVKSCPLYDIYDDNKQTHFGLKVKLKHQKRFPSPPKVMPFWFASKEEADKAAVKINEWSMA